MASPQLAALIEQLKTERAPVIQLLERVLAGQVPVQTFLDLARQQPEPVIPDGCLAAVEADGVRGEWITAPGVAAARTIVYIHGGGWFRGSPRVYREFLLRLSAAAGARVFAVQYRLAPEAPFPNGLDDCVRACQWLLSQPVEARRPALMGDSAGGNLALATALRLRDLQLPQPAALACLSAVTDLAITGESHIARQAADPTLGGNPIMGWVVKQYLGATDPRQPLASPLYADLRGLPPLLVQVGSAEVLLDDSRRLAQRAAEAGVEVSLEVWEDMPHVFQFYAAVLPEGQQAIERIGAFARQHLGG
jgi:acetyl esterase/lipase